MHWSFSQQRVTQSLQESFPAAVSFRKFHSTYLPHTGCGGEDLIFTRLGSWPVTPPIVTIQRFTIQANFIDLFLRPGFLSRIILNGFRVTVRAPGTTLAKSDWKETPSNTRVGEIVADGVAIEIDRAENHPPLLFDVHTLRLTSVIRDKAMSYTVSVQNPLPPGEIRAHGQFGP